MGKNILSLFVLLTLGLFPFATLAGGFVFPDQPPSNQPINVLGIIDRVFVAIIWPVAVFVVILTFIWAGFLFLTSAGNQSKIDTARKAFFWGMVGVGVIVLSFSMILLIRSILGL